MAAQVGIGKDAVARIWADHGLKPWRIETFKISNDPRFEEKAPMASARAEAISARVHDLRHTAATIWLASGADPKVVQRILGHATATMTMDLYGHLIDASLWDAARRVGNPSGTRRRASGDLTGTQNSNQIEQNRRK